MNNLKILYYDSNAINVNTFENLISEQSISIYKIKPGLLLVNYNGSSKQLFDAISTCSDNKNVMIIDLDPGDNTYWGYMSKDLWTWLADNKQQ